MEDWSPGRPAEKGGRILIRAGNTLRDVLALPAIIKCFQAMYPTCSIEVMGCALFTGMADSWPGVTAATSGKLDQSAYRSVDLRTDGLAKYFLAEPHLKPRSIQYQVHRAWLATTQPESEFKPESVKRLPGDHIVVANAVLGGWPDLADAIKAALPGRDVRILTGVTGNDARIVRGAKAVFGITLHPLLYVARLADIPVLALIEPVPKAALEVHQLQMGATRFHVDFLRNHANRPPEQVARVMIQALGLDDEPEPETVTPDPEPEPDEPRFSRRRRGRIPEPEPETEPEIEGEDIPEFEPEAESVPDPDQ
jgi:hypothetical protein